MNSPIPKRWLEILALRSSFTGTNEAFCKSHQGKRPANHT